MLGLQRAFRDVDLVLSQTDEERAYLKGKHAGFDSGRKQGVLVCLLVIALMKWFGIL